MASPLQLATPLAYLVIFVIYNLAIVQADTETFDDLNFDEIQPESRLSFTTGNLSLSSIIPDAYVNLKQCSNSVHYLRMTHSHLKMDTKKCLLA